jgi:predicted glycoside hydrolase/deacetylase ChbG (UPF0249 family)
MSGVFEHAAPAGRARMLIVNADDFGLTDGVCEGIVRSIRDGIVTSTSAMVCCAGARERLRRWGPMIPDRIGVHLQLTTGTPILPPARVRSLAGASGEFARSRAEIPPVNAGELFLEWRAQVNLLLALGIEPTHVDTHHHVHARGDIFDVFCEVAAHFDLPARPVTPDMAKRLRGAGVRCTDVALLDWFGGELSEKSLLGVLENGVARHPGAGCFELMCHPGFRDPPLEQVSRYVGERETELRALTAPGLREAIAQADLHLFSYKIFG